LESSYPYDKELVSQDCGPLFTKEKGPKRKSGTLPIKPSLYPL
jgi:hypothetical protein